MQFITIPVILAYEACLINGHSTRKWRYFAAGGVLISLWIPYRFSYDLFAALALLGLSLVCLFTSKILIDPNGYKWWRRKLTSNEPSTDSFDRWCVFR